MIKEREIKFLINLSGKAPFEIWFKKLGISFQIAIDARLTRICNGNFGDHKSLGGRIYELKIDKGRGMRIYYGIKSDSQIILIGGGDKSTQKKDIIRFKELWRKWINEN